MSFDLSDFRSSLANARAAVAGSITIELQTYAMRMLENPPYAEPTADEIAGHLFGLDELVTDATLVGTVAEINVLQLYDWVLQEPHKHCHSDDGHDCPSYAANGPYTSDTLPAQPGDGSTPCKSECFCLVVPRPPTWDGQGSQVLQDIADAVGDDVAQAWRS